MLSWGGKIANAVASAWGTGQTLDGVNVDDATRSKIHGATKHLSPEAQQSLYKTAKVIANNTSSDEKTGLFDSLFTSSHKSDLF